MPINESTAMTPSLLTAAKVCEGGIKRGEMWCIVGDTPQRGSMLESLIELGVLKTHVRLTDVLDQITLDAERKRLSVREVLLVNCATSERIIAQVNRDNAVSIPPGQYVVYSRYSDERVSRTSTQTQKHKTNKPYYQQFDRKKRF